MVSDLDVNAPERMGLFEINGADGDAPMSNCEHSIDSDFADHLIRFPVFGQHAAYNFCGYVWHENGKFHEEVWLYNSPRETISADTLEELMEAINDKYGSE